MPDRYFELLDHIGVEPDHVTDPKTGEPVENKAAGELQPIQHWKFNMATVIPTMVAGKLAEERSVTSVTLEPIRGTRIFKIDDPVVAAAAAGADHLVREIDPPSQPDLKEARKDTEAARQPTSKKEK